MTAVQIFRRENRLAKLIRKPGGISRKIAMAQAASNLGEIRDELILELDRILALIDRSATAEAANDNKAQAIIYHGSNHIIGLAEPCGIPELGKAAFSLCELVDRMTEAGAWNAVAVQVHLEAFKLLRGAGAAMSPADRQAVVTGLRKVTTRVAKLPDGAFGDEQPVKPPPTA